MRSFLLGSWSDCWPRSGFLFSPLLLFFLLFSSLFSSLLFSSVLFSSPLFSFLPSFPFFCSHLYYPRFYTHTLFLSPLHLTFWQDPVERQTVCGDASVSRRTLILSMFWKWGALLRVRVCMCVLRPVAARVLFPFYPCCCVLIIIVTHHCRHLSLCLCVCMCVCVCVCCGFAWKSVSEMIFGSTKKLVVVLPQKLILLSASSNRLPQPSSYALWFVMCSR